MHDETTPEIVLIVREQGPPVRVLGALHQEEYDIGANGVSVPLTEVFIQGEETALEPSVAREMALAVLRGDEEAALQLADYVLEEFHRKSPACGSLR